MNLFKSVSVALAISLSASAVRAREPEKPKTITTPAVETANQQKTTAQLVEQLYRCVATSKEKPTRSERTIHHAEGELRNDNHLYRVNAQDTYTIDKRGSKLTKRVLSISRHDRLEGTDQDIWHLTQKVWEDIERIGNPANGFIYAQHGGQIAYKFDDHMNTEFDGRVDRVIRYNRKDKKGFPVDSIDCFTAMPDEEKCYDYKSLPEADAQVAYRATIEALLESAMCKRADKKK